MIYISISQIVQENGIQHFQIHNLMYHKFFYLRIMNALFKFIMAPNKPIYVASFSIYWLDYFLLAFIWKYEGRIVLQKSSTPHSCVGNGIRSLILMGGWGHRNMLINKDYGLRMSQIRECLPTILKGERSELASPIILLFSLYQL